MRVALKVSCEWPDEYGDPFEIADRELLEILVDWLTHSRHNVQVARDESPWEK